MRLDNIKLIRVTYADLIGSSSVSRAQIINTMQPTVPTRARRAPRLGRQSKTKQCFNAGSFSGGQEPKIQKRISGMHFKAFKNPAAFAQLDSSYLNLKGVCRVSIIYGVHIMKF